MKIAIGTAQLIDNYGFLNKYLPKKKIPEFFSLINKFNNIRMVDTASSYSNAEKLVGKYIGKRKKISTKISSFNKEKIIKIEKLKSIVNSSLKNLKRNKIEYLMFHDELDIKGIDKNIINYLNELKRNNKIKKFGISIYNIFDIEKYQKKFKFDFFQLPLNIFNINQKKINLLKKLKKKYNIEYHGRSILLQGLAMEKKLNKRKFPKINEKLKRLAKYEKLKNVSRHNLLINAIVSLNLCEYIIIGCSSIRELKDLGEFKIKKIKFPFTQYYISNQKEVDPRYW